MTITAAPESSTEKHVPRAENGLPSPADLPEASVAIYDGKCMFCTKQIKRIHRLDGKGRLAFVSIHDPYVAQEFPDLSYEQLLEQMYVVDKKGNRYGGAAAFRYFTRLLPALWILAPLMHIPFTLPLWQWCYMQVAKRRYKLSKDQGEVCEGTCEIHFGDKK